MTYVAVTHKTGEPIAVTSGHTHESCRLAPGQTKDIPYTAGTLMVETRSGENWSKPNVTTLDGQNQGHFIFWQKRVKGMTIEKAKQELHSQGFTPPGFGSEAEKPSL